MNSESMPKVSVVIPTYNHGRYIRRALESVINQTWSCIEIIVVDNYSTDNTADVVKSIGDVRIKYFLINNQGVIAKSRNFGLSLASGDWIAFLDSDDWWRSDKIERCLGGYLENVDLIYHDMIIKNCRRISWPEKRIKSWQLKNPVLKDLLLKGNAIATSSVIVRKKVMLAVGGMCEDSEMVGAEDFNTWLRIARLTEGFLYLPYPLGFYFFHNQGVSRKNMTVPFKKAIAEFSGDLDNCQSKSLDSRIRYVSGRFHYSNGNYHDAKIDLQYCIKYWKNLPITKVVWMLLVIEIIYWIKLVPRCFQWNRGA
jgi:glycosyltransferase involved in cell wall biosynthesis